MKKRLFGLALIIIGISVLLCIGKCRISENIDAVSSIKVKAMINQIIHEEILKSLPSDKFEEKLFIIDSDKNKIKTVQSNTRLLNEFISRFVVSLENRYEKIEPEKLTVPLGVLFGSKFLSEFGPKFTIEILPLTTSECDFKTEFTSEGINQTKYKVYIVTKSTVRVLCPFASKDMEVNSKVLLAEMVIVGNVPNSYVNVPKDEILDAIN